MPTGVKVEQRARYPNWPRYKLVESETESDVWYIYRKRMIFGWKLLEVRAGAIRAYAVARQDRYGYLAKSEGG